MRTLDTVVSGALARLRFNLLAVASFALIACRVMRRTREVGVRLALGVRQPDVSWLLLRDGLQPVLIGRIVGDLVALAAAPAMRAMRWGVAPIDPVSFGLAGLGRSIEDPL